jgi:hypothetical protein
MLPLLVSMIAGLAIVVGFAFILGKTVPSMPNKVFRFVLLFVLCLPLTFAINYVNVRTLGYHKMGWTGAFIIALLFATFQTFFPSQADNSDTP